MASEALRSLRNSSDKKNKHNQQKSYWNDLVSYYEKRNASLEKRHDALAERVRIMELALPSVLMGTVANINNYSLNDDTTNTGLTLDTCQFCTIASNLSSSDEKISVTKYEDEYHNCRNNENEVEY